LDSFYIPKDPKVFRLKVSQILASARRPLRPSEISCALKLPVSKLIDYLSDIVRGIFQLIVGVVVAVSWLLRILLVLLIPIIALFALKMLVQWLIH